MPFLFGFSICIDTYRLGNEVIVLNLDHKIHFNMNRNGEIEQIGESRHSSFFSYDLAFNVQKGNDAFSYSGICINMQRLGLINIVFKRFGWKRRYNANQSST